MSESCPLLPISPLPLPLSLLSLSFRRTLIVTKSSKYLAWVIVILLNFVFIYFSLLRGLERGYGWQRIYVLACLIQFVVEILIYETSECVIIQFLLPNTALSEVTAVMKLLTTLISQVCQHIDSKSFSSSSDGIVFNSSQYFFVSTNLSRVFPQLFESAIISSFRCLPSLLPSSSPLLFPLEPVTTISLLILQPASYSSVPTCRSYLPGPIGMKWNHTFSSPQSASAPLSPQHSPSESHQLRSVPLLLWISLHTSLTRCAQFLASLPPLFQRLIVHSLQPIVVALVLIIWVQLYNHPMLFLLLLGLLLLLASFKVISRSMNRMIAERNSLKFSLDIVTKQTTELLSSSSLEPEHSSIDWAISIQEHEEGREGTSNPLNAEMEMEDEESCIEMTQTTRP
jgi:hypothetical protein